MKRDDRQAVRLSKGAAREIARQATRVQRDYLNSATSDFRPRPQPLVVMKAIVTSSSITACSGTTVGTGTATIYSWNTATSTMTANASRTNVTVLNWFTGYAPTAGSHVMIYWEDNALWLGPGDC